MSRRVPSSPYLIRPVVRALWLGFAVLLVAGWLVPAPLEPPADAARPPNPARSAWFLLWLQELVSYRTEAVWVAVLLVAALVSLPWWPLPRPAEASWLARERRPADVATLAAAALVLVLTIVALFFRGPDWRFVLPS